MNSLDIKEKDNDCLLARPKKRLLEEERHVLKHFPGATEDDWEDWHWHLRQRFRSKTDLERLVPLTLQETRGIEQGISKLTMSIPPYFASLIDLDDPQCPIRRQCIPLDSELESYEEEMDDPCAEDKHSVVHGLVHRYPDRVLFLVNEMCAMYCRHCTRSRMVGDRQRTLGLDTYNEALDYIRAHKEIRDVLLSGGDPLMLSDRVLAGILEKLRQIPHVEFVRIGTRVPVTLPQRITKDLIAVFKEYSPLWMSLHFNHPKEITPRVEKACGMLADCGIPLGSQTVLLKGINDNPEIMKSLFHRLLKNRVRPYYIYQCDPIKGSRHFRTPVSKGIEIIEQLRGHTTGYAVPTLVIDGPGGGGKIPIGPDYIVSRNEDHYVLRNYAGDQFIYHDPK